MSYQVVLPVFEGPFDLLLHLIGDHELDIYDIPIAFITGQYMDYLRKAEEIDLNLSGEFLVMAGTLLVIKAKTLLPKRAVDGAAGEVEEDPREELVEKLLAYRFYKENAGELKKLEESRTKIYFRDVSEKQLLSIFPTPNPVEGLKAADLQSAFQEILRLMAARGQVLTVRKDDISVRDRMNHLMRRLSRSDRGIRFAQLMEECETVWEAITIFLALLELLSKGRISVRQSGLFSEIVITAKEKKPTQEEQSAQDVQPMEE
jgi:segregation and condensation protein A